MAIYNIGPGQTYTTFTALVAAVTLQPGDIVDGGGNTFIEEWAFSSSGTDINPIIYRNAKINGNNSLLRGAVPNNHKNWIIEDCELFGQLRYGIQQTSDGLTNDNVIIRRCKFVNIGDGATNGTGVQINGGNVKVLYCDISQIGNDGIFTINADFCEIGYNKIYDVDINQDIGDCIQTQGSFINGYIHDNETNNDNSFQKGNIILGPAGPDENIIVEKNTIQGGKGFIFETQANGVTFRRNIVIGNPSVTFQNGVVIKANNLLAYDNIVRDIGSAAFYNRDANGTFAKIYNNTISRCPRGYDSNADIATSATFENNILYEVPTLYESSFASPFLDSNNNDWYTTGTRRINWDSTIYNDLSSFQIATGLDADSIDLDPKLLDPDNNNYKLKASSPCISAGSLITHTNLIPYSSDFTQWIPVRANTIDGRVTSNTSTGFSRIRLESIPVENGKTYTQTCYISDSDMSQQASLRISGATTTAFVNIDATPGTKQIQTFVANSDGTVNSHLYLNPDADLGISALGDYIECEMQIEEGASTTLVSTNGSAVTENLIPTDIAGNVFQGDDPDIGAYYYISPIALSITMEINQAINSRICM